jgi:hypothetical protein
MKQHTFRDFQEGYRGDLEPDRLPPDASPDCVNVRTTTGVLQPRPGFVTHCLLPEVEPAAGCRALLQYVPTDPSYDMPRLIAVIGTGVYATATADQTFETYVDFETTVHPTNRIRMAQYGNAVYLVDGSGPVQKLTPATGDVELLEALPAPGTAPTLSPSAGATNPLPAGDYTFGYCYGFLDGETTRWGPLTAAAASFLPGELYDAIDVTLLVDDQGDGQAVDRVRLFAMTPLNPTVFRLIASWGPPAPASPVTFTFEADTPLGETSDDYLPPPPEGCSIILEWNDRMVYVGPGVGEAATTPHDTLYFSNLFAPEKVCVDLPPDPPDHYGGAYPIGQDQAPILGLGKLGNFLLPLKERAAWLASGWSPSDFRFDEQGEVHGCVAHETVQNLGGNLLVWESADSVWAWDGQKFFELGAPVRNLVQAESDAGRRAAFAVYDPDQRLYALAIPRL